MLVGADGHRRRRGHRLDGHRHAAGGAVEPAAAALQLLQAAVRAGHQPAGRRHPRRDHHGGRHGDRPRGQPARADAGVGAPDRAADAGAAQRGAGEAAQPERHATARTGSRASRCRCCSTVARRAATGCRRGDRGRCARAASEAIADGYNIIILSDRGHDARPRADPGAAGGRGGAAPPAARGDAHARRPGGRERRAARGAPLRAAARLRRQRRSTRTSRSRPSHDMVRQGMLPGGDAEHARAEVRQGGRQGRSSRSARRWGSRPSRATTAPRCSRPSASTRTFIDEYFTWTASRIGGIGIDEIAEEVRQRHERAFPERPLPTAHARSGRPVPVPPRRRVPPVQPGHASTSCSTPAAPATTASSRSTRSSSTTSRSTCARCAA